MHELLGPQFAVLAKLQRERWRDAKRFQHRVHAALGKLRVSFSEWLLLSLIAELMPEHGENISQNSLALGTGLTRMTAGYWIRLLERKGWVDRGEHDNPRAWGVILTEEGMRTLRLCNERLEVGPAVQIGKSTEAST